MHSTSPHFNMKKFGHNRKKLLYVAGITACCLLVVKVILLPEIEAYHARQKAFMLKKKQVEQYRRITRGQQDVEQRLQDIRNDMAEARRKLFPGITSAIAAADIQGIINKTALTSKVPITMIKVMKPEAREGLIAIPVQIKFRSSMKKAMHFIDNLRRQEKLLTIPKLQIRANNPSARSARQYRGVMVNMIVCGFMENREIT